MGGFATDLDEFFEFRGGIGALLLSDDDTRFHEQDRLLLEKTLECVLDGDSCRVALQLQHITRLRALEKLTIDSEYLSILPDPVGRLPRLKELTIASKSLTALPESLSGLTELCAFQISGTPLKTLPGWVSAWKKLTLMDLSWTELHQLPPEMGALKRLSHLNLTGLTLRDIPRLPADLPFYFEAFDPQRRGVCLHDVTLTMQPLRLFQLPPEELARYYDAPLQEINGTKVILLGDGGVGKTYTISRIRNDCRAPTPERPYDTQETHKVLISPHEIKRGEASFQVRFWDFGGQEIMHSMHQCFLTKRSCYVIMVSTRVLEQTTWRAQYWLHTVDYFTGGAPVILAVNCWGRIRHRTGLDETRLKKQFSFLSEIVYFCAIGPESHDLRTLEDAILRHSEDRLRLPAPWAGVRTELLDLNSYYISRAEYDAICGRHGLQDEAVRTWLLEWFHDLGVCLSYPLDPQREASESYKILKPKWLVNAVYRIIWEVNAGRNSLVPLSEIRRVLGEPGGGDASYLSGVTYSETECAYVLGVMRKFKISYPSSDSEEFIPSLLESAAPHPPEPEDRKVSASLKILYPYLPETVLHRLMIQCFLHYLVPSKCWRRGLYLDYQEVMGANALVSMNSGGSLDDCELLIRLYAGERKAFSTLLKFLIRQIREINSEMHLSPQEYILAEQDGCQEWFPVEKLRNLRRRRAQRVQGTDVDFEFEAIEEAFGAVLEEDA